jgi:type IV pilus assembly protein PilB
MKLTDSQLKLLLLGSNLIAYDKVEAAEKEAMQKKEPLLDFLSKSELIAPEQLGRLVADALKLNFVDLHKEKIDKKVLDLVPEELAHLRGVIAFGRTREGIKLGMLDPDDIELRHQIEKRAGEKVSPYYITRQDLESTIAKYKGSIGEGFKKIMSQLKNSAMPTDERNEATIRVVDMLMQMAYENKASDIHIEPYEKRVLVRFRIDGVMHDIIEIPKPLVELMLSRIKILSKMRTDEHRSAQDGKFRFEARSENVDIRVNIVPTVFGEKVVMRILSGKSRRYSLEDLGLSEPNFKKIANAISHPHGMILVTGPTGSGKTTTIYGVLKILNKREVNITTIEDPVEYNIEGITQIQVNTKTDLTFSKGLRAIVRQDPDIIMVGEIRDEETASIAVNSALTGHLVLSTLHTNDAATTLPRLLDMGVEPFLVASTVNVAIAQRLVRQICTKCRASYKIGEDELKIIKLTPKIKDIIAMQGYRDLSKVRLYKGLGCDVCSHTGFSGRLGVFEILEMSQDIKELIIKRTTSDNLMEAAIKNGMTTMLEDGVDKALMGQTTLMEVVRVTRE